MEAERIPDILQAAGHPTRLDVLRLLSKEPQGLASGEIARRLNVVQNTISPHLAKLLAAGLVTATRSGTTIRYRLERTTTSCAGAFLTSL